MNVHTAIENYTYDELSVGQSFSCRRSFSLRDSELYSILSGLPGGGREWGAPLLALLAGAALPGPGTVPLGFALTLLKPIAVGDTIDSTATVKEKLPNNVVVLELQGSSEKGDTVFTAVMTIKAPDRKICLSCAEIPDITVNEHLRHRQLIEHCAGIEPAITAVVHPCDSASLSAAVDAANQNLITPVLVGPEAKIRAVAAAVGLDIGKFRLVPAPHSHAAAAEAVNLARRGEVEALMKGSLHTDELMHEVVAPQNGLLTGRRISHVYLFDVVSYPRPLMITDAAINISPGLLDKRDICQNAIDFAHILGIETPKLALLSAVETINEKLASTLDAAALCKMAERGQITGGILDGPLAFDNAISVQAASIKQIVSPVAGQADILVVPDLESGNMLAKQLTFFDGADGAGIVLGARLPIILTSRADPPRTRLASAALALLIVKAMRSSR